MFTLVCFISYCLRIKVQLWFQQFLSLVYITPESSEFWLNHFWMLLRFGFLLDLFTAICMTMVALKCACDLKNWWGILSYPRMSVYLERITIITLEGRYLLSNFTIIFCHLSTSSSGQNYCQYVQRLWYFVTYAGKSYPIAHTGHKKNKKNYYPRNLSHYVKFVYFNCKCHSNAARRDWNVEETLPIAGVCLREKQESKKNLPKTYMYEEKCAEGFLKTFLSIDR